MAIARDAIAGFSRRLIGPAIALAAAVWPGQPANAMVVTISGTLATLECTGGVAEPCAGFTLDDPDSALLYSLANNNPATEATKLNELAGTDYTTGTQYSAGGAETYSFSTDALYFMIKMGAGEAFFKNLTGGLIFLEFLANGTRGGGLSHITAFDGTVAHTPLPAALPLFSSALALLGLIGWSRRRA